MTAHPHYAFMQQELNEKQWRHYLGSEALRIGHGGINQVMQQSGADWKTIKRGIEEIESGALFHPGERIRKTGGGRKKLTFHNPQLVDAIELEANPKTDKRVMVHWTSRSIAHIKEALTNRGFPVSLMTIYRILQNKGYALKANKKDIEGGSDHPDRDEQFQHINMMGLKMQIQGFPILSIDAKKTEKIGNLKNNGREWMPKGQETKVNVYDFGEKIKGRIVKAIPYGMYDVIKKRGLVTIGIDKNTAEFAVSSLKRWWNTIGKKEYEKATEILLFADCGSSNGYRNKLWKYCLQEFATATGLIVHVCHYPPGTSKWNAIEHEMFSFININWRARPLTAYEVILELIRNTKTKTGLQIEAMLDENTYEKGRKITDEQMQTVNIEWDNFHPEWNYTISPQ